MNKKNIEEIVVDDRRIEIKGKANFNNDDSGKTQKVEVNLIDTLAMNDLVKEIKKISEKEKRSEIDGKFLKKKSNNRSKKASKLDDEEEIGLKLTKLINKYDKVSNDENNKIEYNRSEIDNKFVVTDKSKLHDKDSKKRIKDINILPTDLDGTKALDDVVKNISLEKINTCDKREEIVDKFLKKDKKEKSFDKSVKDNNLDGSDEELVELKDEVQENVENISIAVIIAIVLVCSILGTVIGYMLYKIAMNNSNMMFIFRYFL